MEIFNSDFFNGQLNGLITARSILRIKLHELTGSALYDKLVDALDIEIDDCKEALKTRKE